MKKLYTVLLSLGVATSITAQQLPNNSFDGNWNDCTPWTSNSNKSTKGKTPEGWTISHVIGMGGTGATEVGSQITDGHTGKAVEIHNQPNPYKSSQIVPGYITLGTSWATSKGGLVGSPTNMDGGSFGGLNFTYRPDAVEFYYQRTHGTANTSEVAMVIAYSWKGTTSQASVPGNNVLTGNATTVTMTDRDRNILDKTTSQGGTVTKSADFALISKIEKNIEGNQTAWTRMELPFEYSNTAAPEKLNVIFSAGDYYSTSPGNANSLKIDDVKLLYYSRLASLSVNGVALNGFNSNTYNYTVNTLLPSADAFSFTTLGNSGSGKATISLDTEKATATIKVTNSNANGVDYDGATEHTYTIQFNQPAKPAGDPETFNGNLVITIAESVIEDKASILITPMNDGTYQILLPNFSLDLGDGPLSLGDIQVDNVIRTGSDGNYSYTGSVDRMSLAGGDITANVKLHGTDSNNVLKLTIDVNWINPESGEIIAPIEVSFTETSTRVIEGTKYDGTLVITMDDDGNENELLNEEKSVYINATGNNECTVTLPDFTIDLGDGPLSLGDIVVEGATITPAGNTKNISGSVKHFSLANGDILSNVQIEGTEREGILEMTINVDWIVDNDGEDSVLATFIVTFNGTKDLAAIETVIADTEAALEIFNLNGVRINTSSLTPGIYVIRQGNNVQKVLVK